MGMLAEGSASDTRSPLVATEPNGKDKRASWGLGLAGAIGRLGTGSMPMPSLGAQWGGNGGMGTIRDLGSVVEEEEEEDDQPTPVVPNRLFASTRTIDTVAEEDEADADHDARNRSAQTTPHKATPAAGSRRRPQSLILASPTKSRSDAASAGSEIDAVLVTTLDAMASPDAQRPLRALSLSSRASTGPGSLRAFSLVSPEASSSMGSLSNPTASGPYVSPARERRRTSLFAGPLSGSAAANSARTRSGSIPSTGTQGSTRPRSSISYSKSSGSEHQPEPASAPPLLSGSKMPAVDSRQSVSLASALLAASAAREEADALRIQLSDTEAERDMLRDDVDGWRARVSDLERALQAEKAKVEDERREVLAGRERIRKLGDRLAAASAAAESPTGEQDEVKQMTAAQAKLIGEMRDQIFALAGALEKERADHLVTKETLERVSSPQPTLARHGLMDPGRPPCRSK